MAVMSNTNAHADGNWSDADKNEMLTRAFLHLRSRGISSWSDTPYSSLKDECHKVMAIPDFRMAIADYLRSRTIIRRAVEMFFTYIAMSARSRWQDAPASVRGVTARGWFLGRWLPTFLIIDGPIGRFIAGRYSPLVQLPQNFCILAAAREFIKTKDFVSLRNGFAHWGFDWEVISRDSYVVAYNWDTDLPTVKLHSKEADAFHIIAFAIVEVLYDTMLRPEMERFGQPVTSDD